MSYKIHKFICEYCGKVFLRKKRIATYCSISCMNKVKKKGITPWNKYLKPIECLYCKKKFKPSNHRIKYCSNSCGRKGKPSWNKGKEYLAIRGKKHPNWKGGISKKNKTERQLAMYTIKYKKWRNEVFKRDKYTCVFCGQLGGKIEADHIKPWSKYPKLRYEISNGRTLCYKCHKKTDTYGYHKEMKND